MISEIKPIVNILVYLCFSVCVFLFFVFFEEVLCYLIFLNSKCLQNGWIHILICYRNLSIDACSSVSTCI